MAREEGERIKGTWTAEEDAKLVEVVSELGTENWSHVAQQVPGRTGKSCRLRWMNQLDPRLKTGPFTPEEDRLLAEGHRLYGNKWSLLSTLIPGRSDNAVKNRWNSNLKRKYECDQREVEPSSSDGANGKTSHFSFRRRDVHARSKSLSAIDLGSHPHDSELQMETSLGRWCGCVVQVPEDKSEIHIDGRFTRSSASDRVSKRLEQRIKQRHHLGIPSTSIGNTAKALQRTKTTVTLTPGQRMSEALSLLHAQVSSAEMNSRLVLGHKPAGHGQEREATANEMNMRIGETRPMSDHLPGLSCSDGSPTLSANDLDVTNRGSGELCGGKDHISKIISREENLMLRGERGESRDKIVHSESQLPPQKYDEPYTEVSNPTDCTGRNLARATLNFLCAMSTRPQESTRHHDDELPPLPCLPSSVSLSSMNTGLGLPSFTNVDNNNLHRRSSGFTNARAKFKETWAFIHSMLSDATHADDTHAVKVYLNQLQHTFPSHDGEERRNHPCTEMESHRMRIVRGKASNRHLATSEHSNAHPMSLQTIGTRPINADELAQGKSHPSTESASRLSSFSLEQGQLQGQLNPLKKEEQTKVCVDEADGLGGPLLTTMVNVCTREKNQSMQTGKCDTNRDTYYMSRENYKKTRLHDVAEEVNGQQSPRDPRLTSLLLSKSLDNTSSEYEVNLTSPLKQQKEDLATPLGSNVERDIQTTVDKAKEGDVTRSDDMPQAELQETSDIDECIDTLINEDEHVLRGTKENLHNIEASFQGASTEGKNIQHEVIAKDDDDIGPIQKQNEYNDEK